MASSLKQLAAQGELKKTDLYRARHKDLNLEPGFNLRRKGPEMDAHIESIFQTIMSGGHIPPIEVRVGEDDKIFICDGECRYRAYAKAIKAGADIEWIDVLPFKGNDADRVANMLTANQGLPFTPLEVALGYKRLVAFNWDNKKIATHHGKTTSSVEQLLVLANANTDVHNLVASGAVAAHTAIDVVRKYGEKAGEYLAAQLQTAQAKGKTKVTNSTIEGRALPKKVLSSVVSSIQSFASRLDRGTLTRIAEFEALAPEQLVGRTVEIDAAALLDLMKAKSAVDEATAKQKTSARNAKQAAKQAEIPA
jgi:ParB family chromosome partitioning protein